MLIFLILNIIVILTAYLIMSRGLRIKGLIDAILTIFAIYFTQIVITEIILGIANVLYLKNITGLAIIIFVATYLMTKNKNSSFESVIFNLYLS